MKFKKFINVALTVTLSLAISTSTAFAGNNAYVDPTVNVAVTTDFNVNIEEARNVAVAHILGDMKNDENSKWKSGVKINTTKALFGLDDNPSAYLFTLSDAQDNDNGYIIVSSSKNDNPIVEFAYEGKPFIEEAKEVTKNTAEKSKKGKKIKKDKSKVYYLDDLTYITEQQFDDGTKVAYDISSSDYKAVDVDELKKTKSKYKKTDKQYLPMWNELSKKHVKKSSGGAPPDDNYTFITDPSLYELQPGYTQINQYVSCYTQLTNKYVTNYNLNYFRMSQFSSGGVCYPTAATNLCYYWYNRNTTRYGNLMDSTNGWKGTFDAFYSLMKTQKDSYGTYDVDVAPAVSSYFGSKYYGGASTTFTKGTNSGALIVDELNNDRPCILLVHNNNMYGNHGVLAVGYKDFKYEGTLKMGFITSKTVSHSIYINIADGWSNGCSRYVWGKSNGNENWNFVKVVPFISPLEDLPRYS